MKTSAWTRSKLRWRSPISRLPQKSSARLSVTVQVSRSPTFQALSGASAPGAGPRIVPKYLTRSWEDVSRPGSAGWKWLGSRRLRRGERLRLSRRASPSPSGLKMLGISSPLGRPARRKSARDSRTAVLGQPASVRRLRTLAVHGLLALVASCTGSCTGTCTFVAQSLRT